MKWLSWILLSVVLLVTVFFGLQIPKTKLDYNFESFFPKEDSSTFFFENYRQHFQSDNDFLLVCIERKKGIFDSDFLTEIQKLTQEIQLLDHVTYTRAITSEKEYFISSFGQVSQRPYIDSNLILDSTLIYSHRELINNLVNKEGNALTIFVKHNDYLSKAKSDKLVEELQSLLNKYDFEKVRVAGRAIGQQYYLKTMQHELVLFIGIGFLLVLIYLLFTFKSIWGMLLPQLVLIGSITWIYGWLAFTNQPINILLIVLPPILLVVSMSDAIHLISKYLDLKRSGKEKLSAIQTTIREIGKATFLTSLTTAIGFLSLVFIDVKPIRDFGLYSGIAVMIAFLITYLVLPSLLTLTKTPSRLIESSSESWYMRLHFLFYATLKKRKLILISGSIMLLISIVGVFFVKNDSFIMDNISPKSELKKDFLYFDQHFGGIRPFELAIQVKPNQNIWEKETLEQLEKLEDYLHFQYGVVVNSSLIQTISILNRGSHGGEKEFYTLPSQQKEINNFKQLIKIKDQGKFVRSFLDTTETLTRISGRIPDWGSHLVQSKNNELHMFIQEAGINNYLTVTPTGSAELLDVSTSFMSRKLLESLLFALVIVSVCMGLLFKSFKMLFISLIPNIIPLLITLGFMGIMGIPLNITTALVFTISFGIAVDNTIHFLNYYKLELAKGRTPGYALRNAYFKVGKAILLASFLLICGFSIVSFSAFTAISYLGILATLTLFIALLADLILLPLLLIFFFRK
ncbi:MAG: MMPL family transporter [Brumimicrobium sp.]|nr:MMPL family transporter [Brumimicrobium sp.]